jgi:hypothetical protein
MKVVVLCAAPRKIKEIMLAAEELNMVASGEYVFFNIELRNRFISFIRLIVYRILSIALYTSCLFSPRLYSIRVRPIDQFPICYLFGLRRVVLALPR